MLELQAPPRQRFVLRDVKPAPVKPLTLPEHAGPFGPEEWAKLRSEDRWLATVMGVMAVAVLGAALAVYGTIAVLAAFGWL